MRKIRQYIGRIGWIPVVLILLLTGCGRLAPKPSQEQRQKEAQERTVVLCEALMRSVPLDSIRLIAEQKDDIFFFVYDAGQLVYWSDNRSLRNAETLDFWTQAGRFQVQTVLPLRYPELEDRADIASVAAQTFSFRALLESDAKPYASSRLYFILCHVLFGLVILVGIVGLIRKRGIRNMRLSSRILYIFLTPVLAVFIYIFFMSIRYVHATHEQHQRHDLQMRSEYIQSYLRSLYYWDVALTPAQAPGLAIDLHDLGYDINQDIHVYSLSGELIASSSPALFESGVLSRYMAPEALFSEQHAVVCYEQIASHPYLVSYVPFLNGSFVTVGYIAVPYFVSEQTRNAEVDALLARLLPPYLVVLVLALFFSFAAAKSMTAPISMLTDKMRHFEIGSKNNHIDYPYHDELGALVERYNLLVDRVEESAEKLANAEREGAWRTMARQIAHEINNPLTPMKLSVQKLQRLRGTEQFDAYFEKVTPMLVSEIDNLAHIAQSFSTFAKQPEVVTNEVDVAAKLSNVITLQRANDEQVPIRYVGADNGVMALADNEQISQVFVNIIRNAIQASPTDVIVVLNAAYSDKEVQVSVSDNGTGIPADIQERIFRPNFTTKTNGNGLGLAISKRIVEGTGGRITFETSDKGTTFYVYLRKNNKNFK